MLSLLGSHHVGNLVRLATLMPCLHAFLLAQYVLLLQLSFVFACSCSSALPYRPCHRQQHRCQPRRQPSCRHLWPRVLLTTASPHTHFCFCCWCCCCVQSLRRYLQAQHSCQPRRQPSCLHTWPKVQLMSAPPCPSVGSCSSCQQQCAGWYPLAAPSRTVQ